ncbi:hypothetical protein [Flammeovirga sp. OC4]|uniref:hypothetical protein n=1 Tax=Flammeovirga sp. OC4 TaxID=1382345 RepID=UPI0012E0BBDF|nr:hypothetical protein [Flammeovirga sp. OC4]
MRKEVDTFIENEDYHLFYRNITEHQYYVNLWTAHFLLENKNTIYDRYIYENCLEVIKRYSESEVNQQVASEEKRWLLDYVPPKFFTPT